LQRVMSERGAARGLKPSLTECIGFSTPLVVCTNPRLPNEPYILDLYEHVAFLGDLNQQIASLPDGAEVRLVIGAKPHSD